MEVIQKESVAQGPTVRTSLPLQSDNEFHLYSIQRNKFQENVVTSQETTTCVACSLQLQHLGRVALLVLVLGQLPTDLVRGAEEGGESVNKASTKNGQKAEYQRDLVLHYTFDQRDGEMVLNALGERHPGEPIQATFVEQRKSGMALKIRQNNVKSGYVETADHEDLNAPIFTVAAWINLGQTNSNGSMVCKHDWFDGGARGFVLRCYSGDQLNFTVGAGGWLAAVGKTTLPAHQWIHVVGAFDGTNITVYLNGRLDGTTAIKAPYKPSSYPLRIGHAAYALDTHRKFDGKIDDVMIWKRSLSESEIRAVYDDTKDARPAPLVAADIARLVEQLGSENFGHRENAQQQLIKIGREVLPLLDAFPKADDPEIIFRIRQVKRALENDKGE